MAEPENSTDQTADSTPKPSFWEELKRRKVTRVAVTYVVVSWLVIQVADTTFDGFGIPDWAFRFVVLALVIFFPVAMIVAWAFEMTPEGLKTTKSSREQRDHKPIDAAGQQSKNNRLALIFAAGLPTLIFGALALVFYLRGDPAAESVPVSVADTATHQDSGLSIAVLPLINMSANPENEFFAGGVHEDILTNLSRIPDFEVVSRTTMLGYVNSGRSVSDIGRELGVQYLVEGSVRRIDNHVRVTVQLIDSQQDVHLWANNYDRELTDVFATQSAVARDITRSIQFAIDPESANDFAGLPTHSVKAYDLYKQVRSMDSSLIESEEGLLTMAAMLEEAVLEDPDFVDAWGLLNEIYDHAIRNSLITLWYGESEEAREEFRLVTRPKAKRALDKAVALDPDNLETLLALASDYWAEENVEGFQQDRKQYIDRAMELYPENGMVWYVLGYWYQLNGEMSKALESWRRAIDYDPMNARILNGSSWAFDNDEDQEMLDLIADRLDNTLGADRPSARLVYLRNDFLNTTDPSVPLDMLLLIDQEKGSFYGIWQEVFWKQLVYVWLGDLQAITEMPSLEMPPQDGDALVWRWFIELNIPRLEALYLTGQVDAAREVAQAILLRSDLIGFLPWTDSGMVLAYLMTGETERANTLIDQMLEKMGDDYDVYGSFTISRLSWIDPERAASMLIGIIGDGNAQRAADYYAAFCYSNPQLMAQPEVVAFYVEQGKWVNFLAGCRPEYQEYATDQ